MKLNLLRDLSTRSFPFLLLCIAGIGNAWGEKVTVTFDAETNELNWSVGGAQTGKKNDITISTTAGAYNTNNKDYRIYAGETLTIACDNANITKIVITCSASGTDKYGPGNFSNPTSGKYSYSSKNITGTWTGSAQTMTLTASGSQIRMKKIVVTYEKVAPPPEVSALSITDLYSEIKREYYIGETPSAEGLTVTVTYEDGNTGDITSLVSWTFEPAIIKSSTSSVTATASYGEKSAQHSYDIINKGEKEIHNYTLDLSSESYSSATTKTVKWDAVVADMTLSKGEGTTNANHHLGGNNTETNFYSYHVINITPKTTIHQIVFTTPTSENNTFASILCSSTYTNATASKDGNKVIITPKDGNNSISFTLNGMCECTAMTVYYKPIVSTLTDAGYSTLCLPYNAIVPEGVVAYSASENNEYIRLTPIPDNTIAAIEGVVLKGAPGTYSFIATGDKVNATNGNLMIGVTKDTPLRVDDKAYMLTRKKEDGSVAFRLLNTDYTLGANKAYLKLPGGTKARDIISVQWDENETGIMETMHRENDKNAVIYNLSGQRMKQTQKGINIINGKLVIR